MSDNINLEKVERMARISFENGLRLHYDSILLFNNESFPSAYFISVLALEEIGKSFLSEDFWWHSKIEGRMPPSIEEKFFESMYFHRSKQNNFAYIFDGPIPTKKFTKQLYNGKLEIFKQNSMYVGLRKKDKKVDLKSHIINPLKLKKSKALNQITCVNDSLLEFTFGVIKKVYCVETESFNKILNEKLFANLKKKWPIVGHKTKVKLGKLEKI